MDVIATNEVQVVEVVKKSTSVEVIQKQVAVLESVKGVKGDGATKQYISISTSGNLGSDPSTTYYYYVTGSPSLALPAIGPSNPIFAIKNGGTGTVTLTAATGTLEDGTSQPIYPGETFDVVAISGMWRVV